MKTRYGVMSDIFVLDRNEIQAPYSWLDFGCGAGGFYKHLRNVFSPFEIDYSGIDINSNAVDLARITYPGQGFGVLDIHKDEDWEAFNNPRICKENYDYVVCNGTFTVKKDLTQNQMSDFMCSSLEKLWSKTNKGIAFNCMSKILDFERDDLYHVSFDALSNWVYDNMSSKFTIRQDYGLREFTMYVYK